MKRVFIAFKLVKGKLEIHDHPVFSGDIAYDLHQEQDVQLNDEHQVREFLHEGQAITAISDYMREHGDEREDVAPFVLMQVITYNIPTAARKSAKSKVIKSKTK